MDKSSSPSERDAKPDSSIPDPGDGNVTVVMRFADSVIGFTITKIDALNNTAFLRKVATLRDVVLFDLKMEREEFDQWVDDHLRGLG